MTDIRINTGIELGSRIAPWIYGGPYDRGGADSWYRRARAPHYWPEGTYNGTQVVEADMTTAEIAAYQKGYNEMEASGGHKEW